MKSFDLETYLQWQKEQDALALEHKRAWERVRYGKS
jgi:hypothetical protein